MKTATLSNGIKVGNFSSPHPFNFVDGIVIDRCEPDRVMASMLFCAEVETPGIKGSVDLEIKWNLTDKVIELLTDAELSDVDIYLVPFPVMTAIKEADMLENFSKARVIRVADRETKEIHIDKFCR